MIPVRVELEGFLSYKLRQDVCFDGADLWLLAGANGSGKSSVFDAMTFALFGRHRGGGQQAQALINRESERACVAFEFQLGERTFRAERTVVRASRRNPRRHKPAAAVNGCTRGRGRARRAEGSAVPCASVTRQVYEQVAGQWQPVAGTHMEDQFDAWVLENLGLTFDTFTCSVLLVQGRADALLSADPVDRHRVMASVVRLGRYERLCDRAYDRARDVADRVWVLTSELEKLPAVHPDDLLQTGERVKTAEGNLAEAEKATRRYHDLASQAQRWADLGGELEGVERDWVRANALLGRADAARAAWQRLQVLRALTPALTRAVSLRDEVQGATLESDVIQNQADDLDSRITHLAGQLAEVNNDGSRLVQELAGARQQDRELAEELLHVTVALPLLDEIRESQTRLEREGNKQREAIADYQSAKREFKAAANELDTQSSALAEAVRIRKTNEDELRFSESNHNEARGRLERLECTAGAPACRFCGQSLPPGYLEEERAAGRIRLDEAKSAYAAAQKKWEVADRAAADLVNSLERSKGRQKDAEALERDAESRRRRAEEAAGEYAARCHLAYRTLGEPYRSFVIPQEPDQFTRVTYSIANFGHLRDRLQEIVAARKRLEGDLHNFKAEEQTGRDQGRALTTEIEQLRSARRNLENKRSGLLALVQARLQDLNTACLGLPTEWRSRLQVVTTAEIGVLVVEQGLLEDGGVESEAGAVKEVAVTSELLGARRGDLIDRRAAIPEEARCDPASARRRAASADAGREKAADELRAARHTCDELDSWFHKRIALEDGREVASAQLTRWQQLARLIDRDHLQRHLLRRAEEHVVALAGPLLGRLSGGQLVLGFRTTAPGEVLALEVNGGTVPASGRDVAFLSGSERFRVAISLALAIGQYATASKRPVQAVMVDEGFGCLDPVNRQLVIRELLNLRGTLTRVVLVSHLEEFADHIPHGYRFERHDGGTVVRRVE